MGTSNGVKVTIMLEELLAASYAGADYDAWLIKIGDGDQFGSEFVGGGFGHFFAYAPLKMQYPIDRYTMERKRQLRVRETNLAVNQHVVGDDYTIADMAIWPWYGAIMREAYARRNFWA